MRIVLALVSLVLAGAAAACSGGGQTQSAPTRSNPPRGTVVGIIWHESEGVLHRFDRTSLAPASGRVELGRSDGAWSFSPDESKVAVAGEAPLEVRIVDVRRMRLTGAVQLPRNFVRPPGAPAVVTLAWPTTRRILVLVEWGAWNHALVLVDPVGRRVISREPIDGTLVGQARTHDGLALLLAPAGRIGSARLLVMDGARNERSIPLAKIDAGLETIDAYRDVARLQFPALAVDPTGQRAFVIPAAGNTAAIDLVTGRVVYHTLREPVSLLGRLRNWLEPAAEAKAREGPERQAAWLGGNLVAVSGQDAHRLPNGEDQEQTTPAGLALIDVRRWTTRTLDEQASQFSFSAGTLLAYGTSWNSATQETAGMGLTAYGRDGKKRFHLFDEEPIYYVETAGSYAYVWREDASPVAVDLRSGSVIGRLNRYRGTGLPALMVP